MVPTAISAYLIESVLKPNEKPAGWKYYLVNFTCWLGRMQLYIGGIFVNTKGTPADPKEARILTLAPHGTLIDGFLLLFHAKYHALPSPISAKENLKIPIVGQLISGHGSPKFKRFPSTPSRWPLVTGCTSSHFPLYKAVHFIP